VCGGAPGSTIRILSQGRRRKPGGGEGKEREKEKEDGRRGREMPVSG
jgi:hypothetical protein